SGAVFVAAKSDNDPTLTTLTPPSVELFRVKPATDRMSGLLFCPIPFAADRLVNPPVIDTTGAAGPLIAPAAVRVTAPVPAFTGPDSVRSPAWAPTPTVASVWIEIAPLVLETPVMGPMP